MSWINHHHSPMIPSQVQYYVIQYKPKAATWDYKEISGAITNFYDIRGLRWVEADTLKANILYKDATSIFECVFPLLNNALESINDSLAMPNICNNGL